MSDDLELGVEMEGDEVFFGSSNEQSKNQSSCTSTTIETWYEVTTQDMVEEVQNEYRILFEVVECTEVAPWRPPHKGPDSASLEERIV